MVDTLVEVLESPEANQEVKKEEKDSLVISESPLNVEQKIEDKTEDDNQTVDRLQDGVPLVSVESLGPNQQGYEVNLVTVESFGQIHEI